MGRALWLNERNRDVSPIITTKPASRDVGLAWKVGRGNGTVNRQQLQATLREQNIRDNAYDLNGGHMPETYTLSERDDRWVVYYSERGLESGKREFATESEACQNLLNQIMNDPTTRH
jgi:hypothetical protein